MAYSLILVAGLGLALGTGAVAQDLSAMPDDLPWAEIAPGSEVAPLSPKGEAGPVSTLMQEGAAAEPLVVGTSGLIAFGPEGVRLPRYEAEIATGTVTPRR